MSFGTFLGDLSKQVGAGPIAFSVAAAGGIPLVLFYDAEPMPPTWVVVATALTAGGCALLLALALSVVQERRQAAQKAKLEQEAKRVWQERIERALDRVSPSARRFVLEEFIDQGRQFRRLDRRAFWDELVELINGGIVDANESVNEPILFVTIREEYWPLICEVIEKRRANDRL